MSSIVTGPFYLFPGPGLFTAAGRQVFLQSVAFGSNQSSNHLPANRVKKFLHPAETLIAIRITV